MMSLQNLDKIQLWKDQLIQKGLILSKQRLLIIETLFNQPILDDIEGVWLLLRQEHQVSWATFYGFIRLAIKEGWLIMHGEKISCARFELHIHK